MIRTARLLLRSWREADRTPYAEINEHPEVEYWLGGSAFRDHQHTAVERYNAFIAAEGYGPLAVERLDDGRLIGMAGVWPVPSGLPIEGHEIGWRLHPQAWRQGYASEAAAALLADAFGRLEIEEVISFTPRSNLRSVRVMHRIGMTADPARDFDHPGLAPGDPLRPHVVYAARPG